MVARARLHGVLAPVLVLVMELARTEGLRLVKILPLSGVDAGVGAYYDLGYRLAQSEFEAAGGLRWRGERVDLSDSAITTLDSRSDGALAAAALGGYLSSHVPVNKTTDPVVVLGGYSSDVVRSELSAADASGFALYMNGGGATSSIYAPRAAGGVNELGLGFGLLSSVGNLARTTLDSMKLAMDSGTLSKPARVVLLWEDSDHGAAYQQAVTRAALAEPAYFEVVYGTDFPYKAAGAASFSRLRNDVAELHRRALQASGRGLTALMADAHSAEFVALQDELAREDLRFEFVTYGARGVDPVDVAQLSKPVAADRTVAVEWWSSSLNNNASRAFLRKWRQFAAFEWADRAASLAAAGQMEALFALPAAGQPKPAWYGAMAYAACTIMLRALNATGGEQTLYGVRDTLRHTLWQGTLLPGGQVVFNANNQVDTPFTVTQGLVTQTTVALDLFNVSSDRTVYSARTVFPRSERTGDLEAKAPWNARQPPCSGLHIGFSVASCDAASKHVTSFFWLGTTGRPCPEAGVACACQGGAALPAPVATECEYVAQGSQRGTLVIAVASICAAWAVSMIAAVLALWSSPAVKAGQPEFLLLIAFAALWMNMSALSFLGPNTTSICVSRVLSLLLSVTLLLASLTVKVYRIYRIWNNATMKRVVVQVKHMMAMLGGIMSGILVLFIVWAALDTPVALASTERLSISFLLNVEYQVTKCRYFDQIAFPVLSVFYMIVVLVFCNVLSYQGRNADAKYMESRGIMFASYIFSFVFVLVTVLAATTDLPTVSLVSLIGLSLSVSSFVFVALVIAPKVYYELLPRLSNATSLATTKSRPSRSESRQERTSPDASTPASTETPREAPLSFLNCGDTLSATTA